MARTGRPTDCTPDLTARFVAAIAEGCTVDDAADLSGISRASVFSWMQRGHSGEQPFADFLDATTRARAQAKAEAIKVVREGKMMNGDRDWRASLTLLERQYPAEYGPQQAVTVKVENELEKALDKLEGIKAKIGEDAYRMVLAAIAGETGGETPTGNRDREG
jgi:hypothetical protein